MKKLKLLTSVLLIVSVLLSICPQAFAATLNWITNNPVACNYVYDYFEFGAILRDNEERLGFIKADGHFVIPYDRGHKDIRIANYGKGYLSYVDAFGQAGVLDTNGNVVIPSGRFDFIDYVMDNGNVIARKMVMNDYGYEDWQYGLLDARGNEIIPYGKYEKVEFFSYNYVTVRDSNYNYGLYTDIGQPVIPIEYGYTEIQLTGSPYRFVCRNQNGYFIVDNSGQYLMQLPDTIINNWNVFDYIEAADDYASKHKIYDLNGALVGELQEDCELICDKFIYNYFNRMLSDLAGNIIIAPDTYDNVHVIDENYIFVSDENGNGGLINAAGNVIAPVGSFKEVYSVEEVINDKYILSYGQVFDIYGNPIFDGMEWYPYHLGNGVLCLVNYVPETMVSIAKLDGDPVKPAAPAAPAAPSVNVVIDGMPVQFTDQAPVIIEGRTLLPLRMVFELLGATIDWNGDTQTVTATKDGVTVTITIGSNQLFVNGEAKTLDVPAQILNSRTMVPVRAASEAFGCGVGWDAVTSTVTITK